MDASNIVVAGGGSIAVAPVGTGLPSGAAGTLNTAFTELGYVSEDGVTFGGDVEVEDINSWQAFAPTRKIVTGRATTLSFELQEWTLQGVKLAFGGGTWTEPGAGTFKYEPPAPGDALAEYALVLSWQDGVESYRVIVPRGVVDGAVETNLTRTGEARLPISFSALATDATTRTWHLLTDATQLDPAP